MILFRITQERYAYDRSGRGAKLYGGRWNLPGHAVLYFSTSSSLAMMEVLVHAQAQVLQRQYILCSLHLPDAIWAKARQLSPPKDWGSYPPPEACAQMGSDWLLSESSLILRVPSVINPYEENVLVNPAHPDFADLPDYDFRPLQFDLRLLGLS